MQSEELLRELNQMADRLQKIRAEDSQGWVPTIERELYETEKRIRDAAFMVSQRVGATS